MGDSILTMRNVVVGKKYKHFKGIIVKVIAIAKDSDTLEALVVYEHDNDVWVRKYSEFISEVDHEKYPNVKQKYRFEEV